MKIENLLFFDIETAAAAKSFDELPENLQNVFIDFCKKRYLKEEEYKSYSIEQLFLEKAALIPEFAEIVCISIGRVKNNEYKIGTLYNDTKDSAEILEKFATYLNKLNGNEYLAGFNILVFDIPFIVKHLIKHDIGIPAILNLYSSKPWERKIFDIFDFWRVSKFEYMPSLNMVSSFLGCGNPKENMNGSEVGKYFWGLDENTSELEAKELIKKYCESDVSTTICIAEKIINNIDFQ